MLFFGNRKVEKNKIVPIPDAQLRAPKQLSARRNPASERIIPFVLDPEKKKEVEPVFPPNCKVRFKALVDDGHGGTCEKIYEGFVRGITLATSMCPGLRGEERQYDILPSHSTSMCHNVYERDMEMLSTPEELALLRKQSDAPRVRTKRF